MKNKSTSRSSSDLPTKSLDEVSRKGLTMVLYGPSGSGKTTIAATAPKPLLYVDVNDRGTESIADVKGIRVREILTIQDLDDTYWWLTKNPDKYKTVVIDTCTQLQTMVSAEVAAKNKRKGDPGDWGTLTKRDWGDISALMKEMLVNFRDLQDRGINVIFIAQDRTFNLTDEEEENPSLLAPEVGPALSPSVAKTLNAAVSVIGNTYIRERVIEKMDGKKKIKKKKIEYCLGIGPSSLYRRKVRKPKSVSLPDVIVDPEFQDIVDTIRGE